MKSNIKEILKDIDNMSLEDLNNLEKDAMEMESSANKYGIQVITDNNKLKDISKMINK